MVDYWKLSGPQLHSLLLRDPETGVRRIYPDCCIVKRDIVYVVNSIAWSIRQLSPSSQDEFRLGRGRLCGACARTTALRHRSAAPQYHVRTQ